VTTVTELQLPLKMCLLFVLAQVSQILFGDKVVFECTQNCF